MPTKFIGTVEAGMLTAVLKTITDAPRFQLWLMREIFNRQSIESARSITATKWENFEYRAYMDVLHNDVRLKPAFRAELGELADKFRQTQLGQLTLPGF